MARKSKKKNIKRNVPQKKTVNSKKSFSFLRKKSTKKERKINKKAMIASIIAVVLAVVVIVAPTIANVTVRAVHRDQIMQFGKVYVDTMITPAKEADGAWTFITPRDFKIMQLSDIELGGGFLSSMEDSRAFNALEAMIATEAPDLLVVTGDLANADILKSGTPNNLEAVKLFAQMIDRLSVYWTVTLGDGDSKGLHSKQKIAEYLASEELKYCLFEMGDDKAEGFGNNVIKIKNVDGKVIQAIYTFDTHGENEETIKNSQIEWYKTSLEANNKENEKHLEKGEITKSLAFMHRPLEEYNSAYSIYKNNDKTVTYHYGENGEDVNFSDKSDDLFETMQDLGSTKGIFCGHDHLNTSSISYDGIRLTYCGSIDYLDYKDIEKVGDQRNCTIIEIDVDDYTFDCHSENYYQDIYVSQFEKEKVS